MNPNQVATVYKKASERYDLEVDFSDWLATGDSVSTGSVVCYEGTTSYTSTMIANVTDDNDSKVSFQIKAGTAGHQYLISVTANTAGSDIWVADVVLVVN